MPARVLDGTSADIQRAPGALSGMQYGTVGITLKRGATGGPHDYFVAHNSAGTPQWALYFDTGDAASWWTTSGSGGPTLSSTTAWLTIITRKASGSSTPRWSVYNHTTAAWTHTAGNAAIAEGTAPGASGTYRFSWEGTEFYNGNAAVGAAWSNRLPWSADAAGDTAIEASGLPWALRHWVTAQPDALWVFDQQIIEQPVRDLTGKGASQSARTGTTVTWDMPPGLDLRSPETIRVKAAAAGGDVTAAPGVIACTTALPAVGANIQAGPSAITATTALPVAAPLAVTLTEPATIATTTAIGQPGVNTAAQAGTIAPTAALPRPAANITAGPAATATTATLPQATVQAGGNITATPSAITCITVITAPGINVGSGPGVITVTITLPTATTGATVKATSTPTVTAPNTSTAAVTHPNTSTTTVGSAATSTSTVS